MFLKHCLLATTRYWAELRGPAAQMAKKAMIAGLAFAFTEFCMFAIWALAFWYGSVLIDKGDTTFADMMQAISAIVFAAITAGQTSALGPSHARVCVLNDRIFPCPSQ